MDWILLDNRYPPEQLSLLAGMLSIDNPLTAREQLHQGYLQFGGWRPMQGFSFYKGILLYPGDPPLHPFALTALRTEAIYVYPGDWIVVLQQDGSFEVCRMD